jgi:hypothetical protein
MQTELDALCVYCGTPRPRAVETCPTCGRPWIDQRLVAAVPEPPRAPGPPSAYAGLGTTLDSADTDAWLQSELGEPESRRLGSFLAGIATVIAVAAVGWLIFNALSGDDDGTALPTTTTTIATTTVPETTIPPETTTTTTTPETTTTTPPLVEPAGDPIAAADLGLGAFALGPLEFGTDAGAALGRLAATFGQPDAITDISGDLGLCRDQAGRAASWGPLTVVTGVEPDGAEAIVGYRLGNDPAAVTGGLATLSGLTVGDTTERLETVYSQFTVEYRDTEEGPIFVLVRTTDGVTLLWGPVTATTPDGIVEGIYSPNPCDGAAPS